MTCDSKDHATVQKWIAAKKEAEEIKEYARSVQDVATRLFREAAEIERKFKPKARISSARIRHRDSMSRYATAYRLRAEGLTYREIGSRFSVRASRARDMVLKMGRHLSHYNTVKANRAFYEDIFNADITEIAILYWCVEKTTAPWAKRRRNDRTRNSDC